ncbi:MAG: peptidoglycan DD-metalloendopeptidase family protein [Pseudomonadales bacterium]
MKFIIVDQKNGKSRALTVNGLLLGLTLAGLLGLPAATAYYGYVHGLGDAAATDEMVSKWRSALENQQEEVHKARQAANEKLRASTLRLAKLQARIVRLDALGERLINVANLDEGEFDFSQPPALGGPELNDLGDAYSSPEYVDLLDQLSADIENREQQLDVLETLLVNRKIQNDVYLAGRPVVKGWMSSRFGYRNDPINGHRSWHNGVDFAGKTGSDVIAVAAGVVVYAASRDGYGKMVEINHGSGFTTRYGHHDELRVQIGDIVQKGQVIGLMGSSGRSTGPHVHFEVFKNGRVVDPSSYIHRASR